MPQVLKANQSHQVWNLHRESRIASELKTKTSL